MLTDTGHQVIDRYGLQDPRYLKQKRAGIPYPTVYVINKTGKVAWSRTEENFRERPTNDDIRGALATLK
jgi:peroxiredoxin